MSADVGMEDDDSASLSADALDETACFPADLGTSGYDIVPTESKVLVINGADPCCLHNSTSTSLLNRFKALGRIQTGVEGSEKLG